MVMADAVDNHVTVEVAIDSAGVPRNGYGVMLIASHNANFAERTRTYAATDEVDDDFATDSPEYLAARAAFAQTPRPPTVKIGRITSPVTLAYEINATAVDSTLYRLNVSGEGFDAFDADYTSDSAATRAEIHDGLVTALNSGALVALTFADKTVSVVDDVNDELEFSAPHGLATGDGPVTIETTGTAPPGLAIDTDYYVIVSDDTDIALATSRSDALAGVRINITGAGTGTHSLVSSSETETIDNNYVAAFAALVVPDQTFTGEADDDSLTFGAAHGLATGDGPVRVSNSGGALPTGLVAATDYYVIRVSATVIKLATTRANAFANTAINLTTDGTGTQTLSDTASTVSPDAPFTVTADAPGGWFSLGVHKGMLGRLSTELTHSAGTLDVDLAAILEEDDEWYALITLYNSKAYVLEAAAWAESNERIYIPDVSDTAVVTTPESTADDVAKAVLGLAYAKTMVAFHPRPAAFLAAAWMGRWLPTDPGKATPKFKTLPGVETVKLTSTQRANLIAKRANSYELVATRGITFEGTVASTEYAFLDVTRNRDWLRDEVKKAVFGVEADADIVPFTSEGVAQITGTVRGSILGIATDQGVIARDPEPVITAPLVSEVPADEKKARELRNVKFDATLQGAIHKVRVLGTVHF